MANSKEGMLPGVSARGCYVVAAASVGVLFLYLAALGVFLITDWSAFKANTHPVLVYGTMTGFIVLAFVITGSRLIAQRKTRQEVRAGYTTLPFGFDDIELRDPKTGFQLRAAGERNPVRGFTLSLTKARRQANAD